MSVDKALVTEADKTAPEQADVGPVQGPSRPESSQPAYTQEDGSGSPHSTSRSQIRNLTLPPVPNFDIPPSPPGSPPPGSTAKFANFLDLKKQGVLFNDRLEKSSTLRNPALYDKLRKFAGIKDEEQYASSLPVELSDRTEFPAWAYKDQLSKTQKEHNQMAMRDRTQTPAEAIAFVRGTN